MQLDLQGVQLRGWWVLAQKTNVESNGRIRPRLLPLSPENIRQTLQTMEDPLIEDVQNLIPKTKPRQTDHCTISCLQNEDYSEVDGTNIKGCWR